MMNSDIVILEYICDILDEKKESIVQYIQVVQLTLHNYTVPTGCEHEAWGVVHLMVHFLPWCTNHYGKVQFNSIQFIDC